MEFYRNDFGEEMGKDQYMSLQSLIKYNDGKFKSEKQGKFILWKWTQDQDFVEDSWITKHGIAKEGMKYVVVDGFFSFLHGKGQGHRPALYLFELDSIGVVARYRGRYMVDNSDGTNYAQLVQVEVDWQRETPAQPVVKSPEKAPEARVTVPSSSEHFGNIGQRYNGLELSVTFVKQFDTDYGISTLHKFKDEAGNVFAWFSSSKTLELGKTYRLNGTIKGHGEWKDEKQTELTRCMKIEEVN